MKLFIVATPLGNLEDITLRALRVLKEVDLILCENPLRALKLLNYYKIQKPLLKYHQHSKITTFNKILSLLKEKKSLALISDAGTPGISDPGNKLIKMILEKIPETEIIAVPGPSAVIAGLSISGFPTDKFLFLGFPPKKKRKIFFQRIKEAKEIIVFYESPYRLLKTLSQVQEILPSREIVVIKELTKFFEKIYRGLVEKVIEKLEKEKIQGEYLVIINPKSSKKVY